MGVKYGVGAASDCAPFTWGGTWSGPQTENFHYTKIVQERIPFAILTKFLQFVGRSVFIWGDSLKRFRLMGTNHIPGTAEARTVTFCTQLDYMKSQLTDDKPPLKGAWSG